MDEIKKALGESKFEEMRGLIRRTFPDARGQISDALVEQVVKALPGEARAALGVADVVLDAVAYTRETADVSDEPEESSRPSGTSDPARAISRTATSGEVRELNGVARGTKWRVLQGDVLAALAQLEPESVDCVVTSPPYYWQRDYEVPGQIGHEPTIDDYVSALKTVFDGVFRVLSEDGTLFLNLGDTYYSAKGRPHGRDGKHNGRQMMRRHLRAVDGPGLGLPRKSLIGIPWRVALALQASEWTLRSAVIWQRPGSLPEPTAHDRPWRTYEHVFVFSKGARYYFNRDGLRGEEDVWKIVARPENPGVHFAPYPRELVDRCLDVGCPPGGTVLDPFVGSGTTMLSALSRKCQAIGIDLKPEYCDFVAERIRTEISTSNGGATKSNGSAARINAHASRQS